MNLLTKGLQRVKENGMVARMKSWKKNTKEDSEKAEKQ